MRAQTFVLCSAVCLGVSLFTASSIPASGEIIRGVYCHPGAAIDNRVWASYGQGYTLDSGEKHSGNASIRCVNADDAQAHGGWQTVQFNQAKALPLIVGGWAKLEGATGDPSYKCSVYLDLALQNGEAWQCKIAAFDPAKSGWQYAEKVYEPPAPISSARVYAFLREQQGTAWFDDIYVGQLLDDKGTRSKNLLLDAGFDDGLRTDNSIRDTFFARLLELGCNAFHFYKGTSWSELMAQDGLPPIEADSTLADFVRDAQRRGLKTWLTVGAPTPPIKDAKAPEFPFYGCVNNRWGEGYTKAVATFAQMGFDGIGVVPDEWTYSNRRVKRQYAKRQSPEVQAFYEKLPHYCDCAVCRAQFRKRYGMDLPDVSEPWLTADPAWAHFAEFRYDSTSAWMQRTVEAVKRVSPNTITDTMICVLPVCSDDRLAAGAAWDKIGVDTELDCLQTDPYLMLHNYLGDSTHYYATETAIHLTEANWKPGRGSAVTLESCRLRDKYRPKDPAEVYGAALSCLAHGARGFFWWHFSYMRGERDFVEAELPFRRVQAAYKVMQALESSVADSAPSGDVLVLYSRGSEDTWDRLGKRGLLPAVFGEEPNPKRGFIAHKHVLYWLLRRAVPFRTTFLDNPDPAKLAAAQVVLVPFPLSLPEAQSERLRELAEAGKTVILMSELSPMDELGVMLPEPRFARLVSGHSLSREESRVTAVSFGKGKIVFLGDDFARGLFEPVEPMKDPEGRVPLPAFDRARTAILEQLLASALGRTGSAFRQQPDTDIELTVLDGTQGRLLLAINWEVEAAAQVDLRPDVTRGCRALDGFRITAGADVQPVRQPVGDSLRLAPQDAVLVRLIK